MRYIRSSTNFRQYQPNKKRWFLFWKKAKPTRRIFTQKAESFGRYVNPFRKREGKNYFQLVKRTLLVVLVIGWTSLMVYMPYFKISRLTIGGLKFIQQKEIEDQIWSILRPNQGIWPHNNYFLVNEKTIENSLKTKFSLNNIQVSKIFPKELQIYVEEKISSIIYDNGQKQFLLDQNGTVIKYLGNDGGDSKQNLTTPTASSTPYISSEKITISSSTPSSTIVQVYTPNFRHFRRQYGDNPLVYDESEKIITEKENIIIPKNIINAIIDFHNAMEKKKTAKVSYYRLKNTAQEGIAAITDKPWKIMFNPADDINKQITNLNIIIKSNTPNEYVDLRFGERIYWK